MHIRRIEFTADKDLLTFEKEGENYVEPKDFIADVMKMPETSEQEGVLKKRVPDP